MDRRLLVSCFVCGMIFMIAAAIFNIPGNDNFQKLSSMLYVGAAISLGVSGILFLLHLFEIPIVNTYIRNDLPLHLRGVGLIVIIGALIYFAFFFGAIR